MKVKITRQVSQAETVDVEFPLYANFSYIDGNSDWLVLKRLSTYPAPGELADETSITRLSRYGEVCAFEVEHCPVHLPTTLPEYLNRTMSSAQEFQSLAAEMDRWLAAAGLKHGNSGKAEL